MAIEIEDGREGAVTVVTVSGRLDGGAAPQLDDHLARVAAGSGTKLVLDLGALDYVSSAGLRVFLKAAKQVKAGKGRLALAAITPAVKEVFDISGFTAIFALYPDRTQAVAALG